MARLRSCTICGKIHSTDIKCHRKIERTDQLAHELRQSHKWHKKSLEIREQSHWLCAVCRDQGIITHENISVHHIKKLQHNPELLLDDENLVALCATHHQMADDGLIDEDYLISLAKKRDSR